MSISTEDFEAFEFLPFRRPLELIDPTLRGLLEMSHLARPLMMYLARAYAGRTRVFAVMKSRHLLILSDRDPV